MWKAHAAPANAPRRPRRARPPQRNLPAPPAVRIRRIGPEVPRTRRHRPTAVLGSSARRAPGSTVSSLPASCPARPPAGSARFCRPCPAPGLASHHQPRRRGPGRRRRRLPPPPPHRPLQGHHARWRGADAQDRRRRPQAAPPGRPGILPDGRKGIIDFQPARGESAAEWERLSDSLHRRRPAGGDLEVIRADGGNGLPAALPLVHPNRGSSICRQKSAEIREIGTNPPPIPAPDGKDGFSDPVPGRFTSDRRHGPSSDRGAGKPPASAPAPRTGRGM